MRRPSRSRFEEPPMGTAGIGPVPPFDIPRPVSTQTLSDVVFVHWAYAPDALRHLVPAGVTLDVRAGRAWVGLVGLRVSGVRLAGRLRVPYLGDWDEINLRLYTVGADGRRGAFFVALEIPRLPVVCAARAARLPAAWSDVRLRRQRGGAELTYAARRRWPAAGTGVRLRVRLGSPVTAGAREHFLTARWGAHLRLGGMPWHLPFTHERWPLWSATLLELRDHGLFAAAGIPPPVEPPDSVLYSPAVHARASFPVRVRR
jgi:uncharacterized protein YqjF (DUF2071 family)